MVDGWTARTLLASLLVALSCAPAPPGPDIVVITLDTLNENYTPAAGNRELMPALAELIEGGTLFENAHTATPQTLPSHTAMFTGLAPHESGVLLNTDPVPGDLVLLAERLQGEGYDTAAFVSFGVLQGPTGIDQGFEEFDVGSTLPHRYRRAPRTVERAREFLRRRTSRRPLFLWIHLVDPHVPYLDHEPPPDSIACVREHPCKEMVLATRSLHRLDVPSGGQILEIGLDDQVLDVEGQVLQVTSVQAVSGTKRTELLDSPEQLDHGQRRIVLHLPTPTDTVEITGGVVSTNAKDILRRYRSEVKLMDEGIASMVAAIGTHLSADPVVAVLSDHGEGLFEHNDNGHANHTWEEQLATVFTLTVPPSLLGGTTPPRRVSTPVQVQDLAPTLLEIAGLEPPNADGRSVLGCLDGRTPCRGRNRWSAYGNRPDGRLASFAFYEWPLKAHWRRGHRIRCFDLTTDPEEAQPLAARSEECAPLRPSLHAARKAVEHMIAGRSDSIGGLSSEQRAVLESMGYL